MEILNFSLNPNGTFSITIRDVVNNENSDSYINLSVEETTTALTTVATTNKSILDIINDLIISYTI